MLMHCSDVTVTLRIRLITLHLPKMQVKTTAIVTRILPAANVSQRETFQTQELSM